MARSIAAQAAKRMLGLLRMCAEMTPVECLQIVHTLNVKAPVSREARLGKAPAETAAEIA